MRYNISILILWWNFYGTLLLNDSNSSKNIAILFTICRTFYFNQSLHVHLGLLPYDENDCTYKTGFSYTMCYLSPIMNNC